MLKVFKTCLLIIVLTIVNCSCDNFTTSIPTTSTTPIPFTPIIINSALYNEPYSKTINTTIEYVFLYNENNSTCLDGARINVTSDADFNEPLIVVVRQKKGILSWPIPLPVENKYSNIIYYNVTSRILCSSKYYKSDKSDNSEIDNFVTISISTASPKNISFNLILTATENFYIKAGESREVTISPSEPVYYGYNFPESNDSSSSVLVQVNSASDVCMTFSIQNTTCPVFDLERNIQYAGYWQTVSQKGGITVPKRAYPKGFFIVLVVKADDYDCIGNPMSVLDFKDRSKSVTLSISHTISAYDYIIASVSALSIIFTFCFIYIIGTFCYKIRYDRRLREQSFIDEIERTIQSNDPLSPQPSGFQEIGTSSPIVVEEDSSLDEDDIDLMEDALYDKDVIRTKLVLSVCDLARKQPKILRRKSSLYLHYLITIAIFYAAPVVQLVFTYQNVLHVTGNQDLCYYNFLCSHPLFFLSDFNHVFSNIGYVLLGLLFIFITYMREKNDICRDIDNGYGIPQHYGLFYAMGFALMMEGVMSGSYHMCPNHSNFQFDSSFMYVIAVLSMVKIYQNRHPDINARAPVTFAVLAMTILLALVGVLDGIPVFWVFFTVIHLVTCLSLSAQIYYMGRWKFNGGVFRRMLMTMKHDARSGVVYLFKPMYWRRLLLLILGNLCNIGLAIYGNKNHDKDFATYMLKILMANLLMYLFFYIVMKLCYKESIRLQPLMYLIMSFITWGGSLYFFTHGTISWALTPAQSRTHNMECLLLNFYDNHDIWHFLSALAMFFSFMVVLTLDDDLIDVHRSQIPVF